MRLSMVHLIKIVLACAVACCCITPLHRLVQLGDARIEDVLIADAFIVPLVWTVLAYVLVKRGSLRSSLIDGLLLWAVAVALGYLFWQAAPLLRRFGPRGFIPMPIEWPTAVMVGIGVPMLTGIALLLIARLICRACRGSSA